MISVSISGQALRDSAYALEHSTRPSAISKVLSASHLALLASIGEKFLEWSDEDPPLDDILASFTPFGYSVFPKDNIIIPRGWVASQFNLVFLRRHEKGGHFAALEQPEDLLTDIEDICG
ncbi:hypothetical protein RU639_009039 [Aspergillus parasiticus]